MPAWLLALGVRASEDVGLGWGRDLERGDLLLLVGGVCRWERRVEHSRVFVATVKGEHLLAVELEAGMLGFANHLVTWRVSISPPRVNVQDYESCLKFARA